jgi:hypothetical protein
MVMPIRDLKPDGAAGADTVGGRRPTAVSARPFSLPRLYAECMQAVDFANPFFDCPFFDKGP